MLKKRLVGTIIVKSGLAVQSFGYGNYLPLGSPSIIATNLDRWGADEIMILSIDRSPKNLGPDFNLIEKISQGNISTPLSYGGGIKNLSDAKKVISCGAERIVLETAIFSDRVNIMDISLNLGAQALIASLPMILKNNQLFIYDYISGTTKLIDENLINFLNTGYFSELLCIDVFNEGGINKFNKDLINKLDKFIFPFILMGGLTNHNLISELLNFDKIIAISIGNYLNYKEHAIQEIKKLVNSREFRNPFFY